MRRHFLILKSTPGTAAPPICVSFGWNHIEERRHLPSVASDRSTSRDARGPGTGSPERGSASRDVRDRGSRDARGPGAGAGRRGPAGREGQCLGEGRGPRGGAAEGARGGRPERRSTERSRSGARGEPGTAAGQQLDCLRARSPSLASGSPQRSAVAPGR